MKISRSTFRHLTILLFLAWTAAVPALGQGDTLIVPEKTSPSLEDFIQQEGLRALENAARVLGANEPSEAGPGSRGQTAIGPRFAKMTGFNCIPTCSETDAKFLAIAGSNLVTLSDPVLEFGVAVPAGVTSFQLGVFDGDGAEPDPTVGNASRWDIGSPALYTYRMFADPLADGTGAVPIELQPGVTVVSSNTMPNNAWIDFTIPTSNDAQAPSGNYFYRFIIELTNQNVTTLNAFKLRSSAVVTSIEPFSQPFSYIGNFGSAVADIRTIYPNFPSNTSCAPTATRSCYDGRFTFYFDIPVEVDQVDIWGGDFDRGNFDGTEADTDDPDTPGAPFLPPWATEDARPEGVALGSGPSTGSPPDNVNPANAGGLGIFQLRQPAVRWDLYFPDGRSFANDNPTGNQEWEKFTVSTAPLDPSVADYSTEAPIPAGVYRMTVEGVDLQNLNAIQLPYRILCVDVLGNVCIPLRPFKIGDTVFLDDNGNGVQDPGEPGIAGVVVSLVSPQSGNLIVSTTTDANGHYSFPVDRATYGVTVDAANFEPGGALDGYVATTDERIDGTVVDDNVLTFDFGYRQERGSLGDFVWLDENGDGVQDPGEPGLDGVRVQLFNSEGGLVAETVTAGGGFYGLTDLFPGTFTVRIDDTTLPAGLVPTHDFDGIGSPGEAVVDLGQGEDNADVDFGYQNAANGRIGDFIWNDLNGNGVQDPGEPGIDGVTVQLFNSEGGFVAVTVTAEGGFYEFTDLGADVYTVVVVVSTLPAGFVPTFDRDGLATPNEARVELGPNEEVSDVDFGYAACSECKGKVSVLTLQYLGDSPAWVEVQGRRGPIKNDPLWSGVVEPGGIFTLVGPNTGNGGFRGTLGTQIEVFVNGVRNADFHTSCSQPIGPGLVRGDFLVVFGASKNAVGPLCPVDG